MAGVPKYKRVQTGIQTFPYLNKNLYTLTRCGVLGVKIGVQPLWLKDGRHILTTMLHVSDCHVVRVTPRAEYNTTYMGQKDVRPCYTGPGRAKGSDVVAMVVVGSASTDPQKFTRCGVVTILLNHKMFTISCPGTTAGSSPGPG